MLNKKLRTRNIKLIQLVKVSPAASALQSGIGDFSRLKIRGEGEGTQRSFAEVVRLRSKEKANMGRNGGENKSRQDKEVPAGKKEVQVTELQERLLIKETEAEELRQTIQKTIEEKNREMSVLITWAEQMEDSQNQRGKKISQLDEALQNLATEMEKLNSERREYVQEQEDTDRDLEKLERKKGKLESFLQSHTTQMGAKLEKLETDIDSLQGMLNGDQSANTAEPIQPEAVTTRASPELLNFIERQIKEVERELECPVCFEIASQAPIFRCEEEHLICSQCREKVVSCPVCRVRYPRGSHKRLRGAERQAERLAEMYKERESLLLSL